MFLTNYYKRCDYIVSDVYCGSTGTKRKSRWRRWALRCFGTDGTYSMTTTARQVLHNDDDVDDDDDDDRRIYVTWCEQYRQSTLNPTCSLSLTGQLYGLCA